MKFAQMFDMNIVPEWRNQYLDYHGLDTALNKATEGKNFHSKENGVDLYFELISQINQKFAHDFSQECKAQLNKIDTFHKEKLSEIRGKYNNLQDQLEQILSSAIYRNIEPKCLSYQQQPVNFISNLFSRLKLIVRPQEHLHKSSFNESQNSNLDTSSASISPILGECSHSKSGKELVSFIGRKLSGGIINSAQKITNNIDCHLPVKLTRTSISRKSSEALSQDSHVSIQIPQSGPMSKKEIISSYKKKIGQLKFAFRELYFNLVLFEQYTQLNNSAFEKILRKHDRMFASTLGRKFYQEYVLTSEFYNNLHTIDNLIEGVEHIYTLHFENGNRRKAIEKLQVPSNVYKPLSPMLDLRVGYELGMLATLFVAVILVGFLSDTGYDWRTVFRLYRSPLLMIIFLFQAGISIVIWKHYKINHVLIFELNPRNNLSFQHFLELASLLGIVWSISVLLFLFSRRLDINPSICPLVVVILMVSYLFNPTATCHHQARFWLIRILGRIFTAPWHPVRVADFWVADQLVSIVPLFLDLEYFICFYTTEDVLSETHLNATYANMCITRTPQDLIVRTVAAALPAWFRCAQCLRRWHDENLRLHLANAGKYGCMASVVILSSISQYNSESFELDTMRIIWVIAAIFTSSLTAYWDIIYDFGLFSAYDSNIDNETVGSSTNLSEFRINTTRKGKKTYPFLRKELVYPVWIYYFAIIENVILRFGWIITISLTEFSDIEAGLVVSLLAPLEMFRRFVWNCIRLENEQLNNCGLFRAVRDIPIEVVAPIDESQLDKVIMMMDSRDGPSIRNRLVKRRALRPNRISFMAMHLPDM